MADTEQITAFHQLRQNFDWPTNPDEQKAALAKALDYQRAFYPVRSTLKDAEQLVFDAAIALLALEMVTAPAMRATQAVKKLKEASSTGASVETEYEATPSDPYPQVTAMLAPLAPVAAGQAGGVRFSRMRP